MPPSTEDLASTTPMETLSPMPILPNGWRNHLLSAPRRHKSGRNQGSSTPPLHHRNRRHHHRSRHHHYRLHSRQERRAHRRSALTSSSLSHHSYRRVPIETGGGPLEDPQRMRALKIRSTLVMLVMTGFSTYGSTLPVEYDRFDR